MPPAAPNWVILHHRLTPIHAIHGEGYTPIHAMLERATIGRVYLARMKRSYYSKGVSISGIDYINSSLAMQMH